MENLLGKRIKEIRQSRNLKQPALSNIVDVDPQYISRIETGKSSPSLDTLEKIAKALDVEVKELFNFSHIKDKNKLIDEIVQKLKNENINKVQLIYQITNDVLNRK
jgi:transcriptional regulator with XRE-family HTH domain